MMPVTSGMEGVGGGGGGRGGRGVEGENIRHHQNIYKMKEM